MEKGFGNVQKKDEAAAEYNCDFSKLPGKLNEMKLNETRFDDFWAARSAA